MPTDFYQTLGLKHDADEASVKAAYRKLAMELHPDRTGGDKKKTEEFKRVNEAYAVLSDSDKRRHYDSMRRNPGTHFGGHATPEDFMRDFMGGGSPGGAPPMPDLSDLNDLFADVFGAFSRDKHPDGVFGTGTGPNFRPFGKESASRAGSAGSRPHDYSDLGFGGLGGGLGQKGRDATMNLKLTFAEAAHGGKKTIHVMQKGSPSIFGHNIEITIPPGIENGTKLRVPHKGEFSTISAGSNGAGDLYLHVLVDSDTVLRREGDDVKMEIHLSVSEAALGTKLSVPTIDGPVSLAIPPGTSSGSHLRLRGRGIASPRTGLRGDQYCRVEIVVPEDSATDASKRRIFEELKRYEKAVRA
jgi:DnaJ-class molecular chaperone